MRLILLVGLLSCALSGIVVSFQCFMNFLVEWWRTVIHIGRVLNSDGSIQQPGGTYLEREIESVIDQHQESLVANDMVKCNSSSSSLLLSSSSSSSSAAAAVYLFSVPEDEEDDSHANFLWRTTTRNGPTESISDWTAELDSDLSNQNTNNQAFSGKHWRLLQCQNVSYKLFVGWVELKTRRQFHLLIVLTNN
ncbi:Protein ENHANCED DISEASE RESISTANCE 2 [Camellia lanceoleosa]|uniref:Protein ENHANCED DISEASE RESISTANCE 2 n=1 Tax=Camellia lanceoleosa TaxID=1840588 RepID=A0ACC0FHI6_9ERIC|nr:Protein ENHANCED DISEASE RESISTANCE 2 [Camellia lanceoleosa]